MKRKGFTLIELIAAIVVLAVISLIAVPVVMNQIEGTKLGTYKASVQNVFDSVTTYLAQNKIDDISSTGFLIPNSEIYQQLDLKNQDFVSGRIYRDENGVLMVERITDGEYCANGSKNDLQVVKGACELLDMTPPEITIMVNRITAISITISVNSLDMESGISSYEYYLDGKLIQKSKDNVYTFKNLQGNKEYTITVKSTNGNNQTAEKKVTVRTTDREMTYKETPIGWSHSKTITITFPRISGNEIYQYKVVGSTDWITIQENIVDVYITNDVTIAVKIIEEGVEVFNQTRTFGQIDNEPPIILSIDGNSDIWKTSKEITISAKDNESGLADYAYSFDGGVNWQKSPSKTFTSMDTVQIAVKDKLDNVVTQEIVIKKVDSTIPKTPTITATAGGKNYTSGTWTNQSVTLIANPNPPTTASGYNYQWYKKVGSSATTSGTTQDSTYAAIVGATGQTYTLTSEQTTTYKVEVWTKAGSVKVSSAEFTVKIDKTAPTCSWNGESTTWTASNRAITATCNDSGSLCATASKNWTFNTTIKTQSLTYVAADKAGNTATCTKSAVNIYVDKTIPTIQVIGSTKATRNMAINFTVTDGESGVKNYGCVFGAYTSSGINYNITGTTTTSGSTISCAANNKLSANTTYYYKITSTDKVGNQAEKSSSLATNAFGNINVAVSDESIYTQSKTATITGTTTKVDVAGTTVETKLQYQLVDYVENETASPIDTGWKNITSGDTVPITKKLVLFVRFTDGFNTTSPQSRIITKIDTTAPIISAMTSSSTTKSITLKYTVVDTESGVSSHKCYFKNNIYTNGYIEGTASNTTGCTISGLKDNQTYDYKIETVDKAGNTATKTGQVKTGSFSSCEVDVPGGWAKDKDVTISGATEGATLQYRIVDSSGNEKQKWADINSGSSINLTYDATVYCRLWDGTNSGSEATGTVHVDTSTPSVSITATANGSSISSGTWTKHSVTLKANPSGSESGYKAYQWYKVTNISGGEDIYTDISGATSQTYTVSSDTNSRYAVKVTNNADTPSDYSSIFTVKIDTKEPSCTNSGDSTTWTNGNRTIYYGCSDSSSGCNSSYSGGSQTFSTTTKTASINAYTIKDNAGNSTTCSARTAYVYVDKTAPSCTNSGDSTTWTNGNRTIYYGCSDSHSGCNSSYNGGSTTFKTNTLTASISQYTIKDNAGNSTTCSARTAYVYVDKTAPTVGTQYFSCESDVGKSQQCLYHDGVTWCNDILALPVYDNTSSVESGLNYAEFHHNYSLGGYSPADGITWHTNQDYGVSGKSDTGHICYNMGDYSFYSQVRACDNAGNCSAWSSAKAMYRH